jgi:hypothetical protein
LNDTNHDGEKRLSGDPEKRAEENLRGQHQREPLAVEWRDRFADGHEPEQHRWQARDAPNE